MPSDVRLHVDATFAAVEPVVLRTLEQLLEIEGWKHRYVVDPGQADLVYGGVEHNCPWPCSEPAAWKRCDDAETRLHEGLSLPAVAFVGESVDWTLVSAILLGGYPERQPGIEQHQGVPGELLERWNLISEPVVEHASRRLREFLLRLPNLPRPRPRWPPGKCWAVSLTHDVDRIRQYRCASFLRDSRRSMAEGRFRAGLGQMVLAAQSACCWVIHRDDPFASSWQRWIEFERQHRTSGTYYVATWDRSCPNSDPRDVHYRCSDPKLVRVVQQLHGEGFEVGLHNSIDAWRHNRYAEEFDRFVQAFGFEPRGYRGHYWSLNASNPARTMSSVHHGTDLQYSSALGMNQVAGFRRGLAYPWRPFDHESGNSCGNWEIPPIMMDQSLMRSGMDRAAWTAGFMARADQIRTWQGCLVLDWHTDTLAMPGYRDMTPVMLDQVTHLLDDPTCWFASLEQIYHWCSVDRWNSSITT